MRNGTTVLMLIALAGSAWSEGPVVPPPTGVPGVSKVETARKAPWIGLQVGKLDEAVRAHAPEVPRGVGFVVRSVDADGPAEAAGIASFDILWKLNDQMLVNEAQFATLLGLHQPGDKIELTLMRSGQRLEKELVISEVPDERVAAAVTPLEYALAPAGVPGLPTRVLMPQDRTAHTTRSDGSIASLYYEGGEPQIRISDPEGQVIYTGPVRKDGKMAVPEEWVCQVGALMRGLSRANDPKWRPRTPRPRVVVPPQRSQKP